MVPDRPTLRPTPPTLNSGMNEFPGRYDSFSHREHLGAHGDAPLLSGPIQLLPAPEEPLGHLLRSGN